MLRKINCVMIYVEDVAAAAGYYRDTFGLSWLWRDSHESAEGSRESPPGQPSPLSPRTTIGLGMPETDAEIVLHDDPGIPGPVNVHYLVNDVRAACEELVRQGCVLRAPPFEIVIGWCAVAEDPFGATVCVLDMSKGPRPGTVA